MKIEIIEVPFYKKPTGPMGYNGAKKQMKIIKKTLIPMVLFIVISSFTCQESIKQPMPQMVIAGQSDDDDMVFYSRTTAYQWNTFAWFDHDALVFKNKRDGSFWIKISIIADPGYVKCRVLKNPDYTGGISGGARTSRKYKAVGNGITYYFNID